MDRDPAQQGFKDAEFDLIVSANAIHAGADLPLVLSRLGRLLSPDGALMLVESTTDFAWFEMSTGLTEGWQHFTDGARHDQPLLSAPQWLEVLQAAGFVNPRAWPAEGSQASVLGQHVVIAQVPRASVPPVLAATPSAAAQLSTEASPHAPSVLRPAPVATLRRMIADALPDERMDLLRDFVRQHVMRVLGRAPDNRPGLRDRLMDIGMDSLMAVQLRAELGAGLDLGELPATLMFDHPTIAGLADALAAYLSTSGNAVPAPTLPQHSAAVPGNSGAHGILEASDVALLSEAQIEALVIARMQGSVT
jgi:hypothetical protein